MNVSMRTAWRRRVARAIAVALCSVVAVLAVAAPANASTTGLGGWHHDTCTAGNNAFVSYGCWYLTDTKGNFLIFGYDSSCDNATEGMWCLVGTGYYHRLNPEGTAFGWGIADTACDAEGPYLNSTGAGGCGNSVQGVYGGSPTTFHVNWGGKIDGKGVTYSVPSSSAVDAVLSWQCPAPAITVPGSGALVLCSNGQFFL